MLAQFGRISPAAAAAVQLLCYSQNELYSSELCKQEFHIAKQTSSAAAPNLKLSITASHKIPITVGTIKNTSRGFGRPTYNEPNLTKKCLDRKFEFLFKGKGLCTYYSTAYISQTQDQQHFKISEVTADWHQLMISQFVAHYVAIHPYRQADGRTDNLA